MRTILFSFLFFILYGLISFAQNWLPLKIGNEWQYIESFSHTSVGSPPSYSYFINYLSITSDTIISNKKYFNGVYGTGLTGTGNWTRYDSTTQQIFIICDSAEALHMDFTLPDTAYSELLSTPYYCIPWDEVWIYTSEDSFLNSQFDVKLFQWFEPGITERDYSISYLQNIGILEEESSGYSPGGHFSSDNSRLIQCNIDGQNISENNSPEILIQPDTTLSDSMLDLAFQVKHKYNHIFAEGSQNISLNFINQVLFHSFYLKQDTIFNSTLYAEWISGTENYSLQIPLEMNLLEDDYKLYYKIEAIDKGLVPHRSFSPDSGYYIAELDTTTDVEGAKSFPNQFELSQNYPNPFNPSTKISWQSPTSGWQTLKVYDVLGNEVATLVDESRNAGSYEIDFNANKLSSGVYYYQIKAGDFIQTKKMILVK